jgi:hypothetical protein
MYNGLMLLRRGFLKFVLAVFGVERLESTSCLAILMRQNQLSDRQMAIIRFAWKHGHERAESSLKL